MGVYPLRPTSLSMSTRALSDLRRAMESLSEAQGQLSTMRRINRPSDDPTGTQTALSIEETQARNTQYQYDANVARSRMEASDAALSNTSTLVDRAKELAVQAASGILNDANRSAIASELDQLHATIIDVANRQVNGEYLFSGYRIHTQPFVPGATSGAVYAGDANVLQRAVADGVTIPVSVTGGALFSPLLAAVSSLASAVRSNDGAALRTAQNSLDAGRNTLSDQHALLGSNMARLESARSRLQEEGLTLAKLHSTVMDADLAAATMQFKQAEFSLQAALQVTARSMPPSLFDFLR